MPVILVIGPSHAGKSTLTGLVLADLARGNEPQRGVTGINLDEVLGSSHRSNAQKALDLITKESQRSEIILIDCGAGLLAFSATFRAFVTTNSMAVIAVWCNDETFRSRHSPETIERELVNNYSPDLIAIWEIAQARRHLVDNSCGTSLSESCERMKAIIARIADEETWFAA